MGQPEAMDNSVPQHALVVDDGELDDVRELLSELGISWAAAPSFDAPDVPASIPLLITNTRHALEAEGMRPSGATHLVVFRDVSRTLRKVLERSGCDLVLQRPINPDTFRLLAAHALYTGPERRRARRVVISAPVKVRSERRTLKATLIQLSLRGCGLELDDAPHVGSELCLTLPRELTQGKPLEARGPVLSVRPSRGSRDLYEVAMAFRLMDRAQRRLLNELMDRYGSETELRPRESRQPKGARKTAKAAGERRADARKTYNRRVLAAGAGISHVLIGRDLSSGGMRVRPDSDLKLGDELRLAVHNRPGQPAVMLKAVVARDDGDDGLLLRFHEVPSSIAQRLEKIVGELPTPSPGERPGGDAAAPAPGVVVSEVLERRKSD